MPQTMAQLEPMLKTVYEGSLEKQMQDKNLAYNRISTSGNGAKFTNDHTGGKYVEFAIHITRNNGIGARNENEALPNAGFQGTANARIRMRHQYGAIEITGQVFDLATKDYQTFANAVDLEIDRLKDDLAKDRNRQYFGNGSGKIAAVVSVSGNVITLDSIQYMQEEMLLDAVVGTNGTVHASGIKVTSINEDENKVTVTGTLTGVVAGDILVRKGSWNREWTGLGAIIDDKSTLYDLSPSTTSLWKSHVNNQGGTAKALNEAVWMRMADKIGRSGGKISAMYTSRGVQRAYWQLLAGQRRFMNTQELKGGYKTLQFDAGSEGSIDMLVDDDAPKGTCIFVDESKIKVYRPHPFKFMDRQGSMWTQKRDANGDYDAYVARMAEYSEIGTRRRNTHGIVRNIIEDES